MRDIAIAHGIQIFVMATGGSVMADYEQWIAEVKSQEITERALAQARKLLNFHFSMGRNTVPAQTEMSCPFIFHVDGVTVG